MKLLGCRFAWLDTSTMDSLVEASAFVQMVGKRQGIKISAPEKIVYKNGWISKEKLIESAEHYESVRTALISRSLWKEGCVTDEENRYEAAVRVHR